VPIAQAVVSLVLPFIKKGGGADGSFVDLVNLRVPGMGLMGLAPEWAGKARHHTRFNAHPVPCY